MQKARRHPSEDRLRPLVSARFQVLLTSLIGVLFNIQSTYWYAIGRQGVFSLGGWTPQFHAGFHEPDATLERLGPRHLRLQGCHLLWQCLSSTSPLIRGTTLAPTTPARRQVWAVPLSLAATDGIEVSLFSCRYLDVSVLCVRLTALCIQTVMIHQRRTGFPHSEIRGSKLVCQLPAAYRRLPRLSSPLDAETSTARS